MSKHDKLLLKLQSEPVPNDITWAELSSVLKHLGYDVKKGTGSRRKFIHSKSKHVISLHEPHPQPHVKSCYIKQVVVALKDVGYITE